MTQRIHNDYVEHVVMYRQVGWDFQTQAVCTCGWEGKLWKKDSFARHDGDMHQRFPSRGTQD